MHIDPKLSCTLYSELGVHFVRNIQLTTDNPVYMDRQDHNEWIIPIEAEIYFPLSKDFCLYMFHDKSKQNENILRQLKIDRVNKVDFTTFESMTKNNLRNLNEFLIMPVELENSDVTKSVMKYENNK